MNPGIVVVAEHERGELADITLEMLACAREVADAAHWPLTCVILAAHAQPFQALPLAADRVLVLEGPGLEGFSPDAYLRVLVPALKGLGPGLVLLGNTGVGMDLAGPLCALLGATAVAGCTRVQVQGSTVVCTSRLYGGKLLAQSELPVGSAVALLLPGSYPRKRGMQNGVPKVEVHAAAASGPLRVRFRELIEPKLDDVDVRKVPVLVAAGRGLQSKENLGILDDLARTLGGAVCATRPVVDQGWLPRSRQVGRSGMTVKPRLYLALGISGAPEHIEGMKESDLIVAVNTDPDAPIFDVAHYGATVDLLDLVPALTDRLRAAKGGT